MSFGLCLAVLLLFTPTVLLSECSWFKDVAVAVEDIEAKRYDTTLNGCIEKTSFDGKVVKKLVILDHNIGNLGEDSVKNLDELVALVFKGCIIDSLSPGAFRNLPKIEYLELSEGNTKEIPRNVFNVLPSIERLYLDENEIDNIEEQAFANLSSLWRLDVGGNKLEYWNKNWFANNTALKEISFSDNQLKAIPRRAFVNLPASEFISFDNNKISVIHRDAFLGLTKLSLLSLSFNRLTEIREDIFPNKISIFNFFINANYLNFLPEGLLQKISVKYMSVDNNPWKCPCFDRINFWLYMTNGTIQQAKRIRSTSLNTWVYESCTGPNIPVCAVPTTYSRSCFEYVDPDLTERYIQSLKNIRPPNCARVD